MFSTYTHQTCICYINKMTEIHEYQRRLFLFLTRLYIFTCLAICADINILPCHCFKYYLQLDCFRSGRFWHSKNLSILAEESEIQQSRQINPLVKLSMHINNSLTKNK